MDFFSGSMLNFRGVTPFAFFFFAPHRGQDALKGKLARSFLGKKSSRNIRGRVPRGWTVATFRAITAPPGSNTASLVLAQHCLRSRGELREKLGTWGPLLFIESWFLRLFQHTFGTHPKPLPTGHKGIPFIVV